MTPRKTHQLFPGSQKCRKPKFKDYAGRTWDSCDVIATDGSKHDGLLDTSWGHWFYFRCGDHWRKAKIDRLFDDCGLKADFRKVAV